MRHTLVATHPESHSGASVSSPARAQSALRWEVLWIALMVVYNVLLDAPLARAVGAPARAVSEILTTGSMCLAIAALLKSRDLRIRYRTFVTPLILFCLYIALQCVALQVHLVVALYGLRGMLRLPLVTLCVAFAASSDSIRKWLLRVVLCIGLVESILLVAEYLTPGMSLWSLLRPVEEMDSSIGRTAFADATYPAGTFPRYNYAAEFLVSVALLAIGGMAVTGKRTVGVFTHAIILVVGVGVTLSRTAQLILLLGGAVVFARRRLILPSAIILTALLSMAVAFGRSVDYGDTTEGSANIADRFLSLFSESYWEVQTGDEELQRWPAALDGAQNTIAKYPWLGTGIGTIGSDFTDSGFDVNDRAPYPTYNRLPWLENKISLRAIADVGWACLFAQLGAVGLLLLGWLYWSVYRLSRFPAGITSYLGRVAAAVSVAFVVFNGTISVYYSRAFLSSAAVIVGVIVSAAVSRRQVSAPGGSGGRGSRELRAGEPNHETAQTPVSR